MTHDDDLERRLERMAAAIPADASLVDAVMRRIETMPVPERSSGLPQWVRAVFTRWFAIPRVPGFAMAGALLVLLAVGWQALTVREADAAQVLARGADAMSKLRSVFMQVRLRTLERDNFEMISVDYDFVPVKMWKEFAAGPKGRWRIEKPGRVVVMDGTSSLLFIEPNHAAKGGVDTGFVIFLRRLLDVHKVVHEATVLAFDRESRADMMQVRGSDGRLKTVITMDVKAQGNFQNAYLMNKSIAEANTRRIYRFDSETSLLEGLEIFVHTATGDVLVLAVTDIQCNLDIDPARFTLVLPPDTIWLDDRQPPLDAEYRSLTPKEMAQAFFQACASEDWNEVLKFRRASAVSQEFKSYLGGLQLLSIGEPFQSGLYVGWFVPYEIRLKNGQVRKHNLAVRNDNPARCYVVDGGI